MAIFSKEIDNFLKKVNVDGYQGVAIVPKSDSCAEPGDFLFFRYKLGVGSGSRAYRILLLTQPITKDAKTGNRLVTGYKVPLDGDYTPQSLVTLYINKELPKENYRTYIMSNIYGPLRRIKV